MAAQKECRDGCKRGGIIKIQRQLAYRRDGEKEVDMDKIVIKRQEPKGKCRRAAVTVKPETYRQISDISFDTNIPIGTIVELLLTEALKNVEIH